MKEMSEIYWHVSNSGVTFRVVDTGYGPELRISMSSFGNLDTEITFNTDKESLTALGVSLILAGCDDVEYSPKRTSGIATCANRYPEFINACQLRTKQFRASLQQWLKSYRDNNKLIGPEKPKMTYIL